MIFKLQNKEYFIEFGRTVALYEEFIICGNEIRLG